MNFTLTDSVIFFTVVTMKWPAVIVLLAIALTVFVPPVLPQTSMHSRTAEIGSLDVCHAATPALAANGEMPCIATVMSVHCPVMFIAISPSQKPFFLLSVYNSDTEHPPKA